MGLDKIGANRGTAVFDMDGNGYLDVMLASNHGGINVYRNNGDGTFTEVTQGSGLEREVETFGVAARRLQQRRVRRRIHHSHGVLRRPLQALSEQR